MGIPDKYRSVALDWDPYGIPHLSERPIKQSKQQQNPIGYVAAILPI